MLDAIGFSALPAGLSFDTITGVISGTPTELSLPVSYTVTASNSGGSTTATLTITVNDVSPAGRLQRFTVKGQTYWRIVESRRINGVSPSGKLTLDGSASDDGHG